ncbi:ABC transporter ATP-binding protein [Candidatus Uhrbacteria bacterium]|nr:ABC transporter ATP-binding protein [Candidatus Uhrbacteria bacterium]
MKTDEKIQFSWRDLIRAYWFLLGDQRWKFLGCEAVLVIVLLYEIVPPLIIGMIVDFFTTYHEGGSLSFFYISTIGLGLSFAVVSFIRLSVKRITAYQKSEVTYRTKVRGFERLLDYSLSWHHKETAGAKAQRIQNGVESFRQLCWDFDNEILRSLTGLFGMIVVFAFLRPIYVLFFLIYVAGAWLILRYFYRRIQTENDRYYLSLEQAGGTYVEGLSNIMTIKTLGANSDFKDRVAKKEALTKKHEFTMAVYTTNLWKSFNALNGISYSTFLLIVGYDIITRTITPGALVIFYGYLHELIGYTSGIMYIYERILKAKSGIGRMMDIFWSSSSVSAGKKKFPADWDTITLNNASFSYRNDTEHDSDKTSLSDIALTIPRKSHIGIVGKTGSGKSTLAKLLAGLFPLSGGAYHIGATSFYDMTRDEQIGHITLVLQETEVFNFSFLENITLMKNIAPEKIKRALMIADLLDVVAQLPEGLETLVGEKGYHLSGGERQRLGIARAICRDPDILILDEATSSLDSATEKRIQRALETQLSEKTLIVIAHRVSTLQNVDRLYVFDRGTIVEEGTFTELSQNPQSKFSELYQEQNEKEKHVPHPDAG